MSAMADRKRDDVQQDYHQTRTYDNGYGVSVTCRTDGIGTYGSRVGLFEIAVLHDGEMCSKTDWTDDDQPIKGWLDFMEVGMMLTRIEALPTKSLCAHTASDTP